MCVKVEKEMMKCFPTVSSCAVIKTQLCMYANFTKTHLNSSSAYSFWPSIQKQFGWSPIRGLFKHVRLINLAVFPLQTKQLQNIVWICSQGQEGKMLAAAQTTISGGMCYTSKPTLVLLRRAASVPHSDGQIG